MMYLPNNKKVILFDGFCNLCSKTVIKLMKFDTKDNFIFCALQSETGKKIANELQIDTLKIDSIILVDSKMSYSIKSTAVLEIMRNFSGVWYLTQIFWLIPSVFRNYIYDFVAKKRYGWFGKKEHCMIPSAQLEQKFLTSFELKE